MKIDRAPKLIRQLQQPSQATSFLSTSTRRLDKTTEGTTGRSNRGRQLLTIAGRPMLHRHKCHELQLQPIKPLLAQGGERLPTAGSTGPDTVDMATNGSQTMTPRQLKRTLAAGLHLLEGARLMLSVVGR